MSNNIFLTTDTHFNHKKIFEFCNRPLDYEYRLIKGFLSLKESDILFHLGDFCIGNDAVCHEFLNKVKAKKILVRGNHDHKSNSWYLDHGWDFVCREFSDKYYGVKVKFSHKPQPWDGEFDVNIHGHLHDLDHRHDEIEKLNKLNKLISLEKMGYDPITLGSILEPIKIEMEAVKDE